MARLYSIDTDGGLARIESDFSEEGTSAPPAPTGLRIRVRGCSVSGGGGYARRLFREIKVGDNGAGPFDWGDLVFAYIEPSDPDESPFRQTEANDIADCPAESYTEAEYIGPLDLTQACYVSVSTGREGNTSAQFFGTVELRDSGGNVLASAGYTSGTGTISTTVVAVVP